MKSNTNSANKQIQQIVSDVNNTNITEIRVIDNKGTVRASSDLNEQSLVGQKRPTGPLKMLFIIHGRISKLIMIKGIIIDIIFRLFR